MQTREQNVLCRRIGFPQVAHVFALRFGLQITHSQVSECPYPRLTAYLSQRHTPAVRKKIIVCQGIEVPVAGHDVARTS